jgi:hypothetical protein
MNHRYRTRIQGEGLQEKIRGIEFDIYEACMFPVFFRNNDNILMAFLPRS